MSTPDSWRRPDHWKHGDPAKYRIVLPTPAPEPRFDWSFVLEALGMAAAVFLAIVVMSVQ